MKKNGKHSERFLCFRTEGVRKPSETGGQTGIFRTVLGEFPDTVSGGDFVESALEKIGSPDRFAVMAMIPGIPDSPVDLASGNWLAVARGVDEICRKKNGAWGVSDRVIGCFIPVETEAECVSAAVGLRQTLVSETGVSIGMAMYPKIHFTKRMIFENAVKALDHAGFPGRDGMAVFDAVTLNISGDRLYQRGDIVGAMQEFEAGLLMDPSDVNLHISLGACHGTLGYGKKALKLFDLALALNPKEAMALYNKGVLHLTAGAGKKALSYFILADRHGADLFEPAFQAGKICFALKEYRKAEDYLQKAARRNPRSGPAFRYLGKCQIARNDTKAALLSFKKAVRINPFDAGSLSALGYLYGIRNENPEIAILFCRHSARISPENSLFRYRLGRLYLRQNRHEEALSEFIEATKLGHDATEFIDRIQNRRAKAC